MSYNVAEYDYRTAGLCSQQAMRYAKEGVQFPIHGMSENERKKEGSLSALRGRKAWVGWEVGITDKKTGGDPRRDFYCLLSQLSHSARHRTLQHLGGEGAIKMDKDDFFFSSDLQLAKYRTQSDPLYGRTKYSICGRGVCSRSISACLGERARGVVFPGEPYSAEIAVNPPLGVEDRVGVVWPESPDQEPSRSGLSNCGRSEGTHVGSLMVTLSSSPCIDTPARGVVSADA